MRRGYMHYKRQRRRTGRHCGCPEGGGSSGNGGSLESGGSSGAKGLRITGIIFVLNLSTSDGLKKREAAAITDGLKKRNAPALTQNAMIPAIRCHRLYSAVFIK